MSNTMIHRHLIVNGQIANPPNSARDGESWLYQLINHLEMTVLIKPRGAYESSEGNRGVTVLAGITTSHIACHFWDEISPPTFNLDIYSCQIVDPNSVREFVDNTLNLISGSYIILDRTMTPSEVSKGAWNEKPT